MTSDTIDAIQELPSAGMVVKDHLPRTRLFIVAFWVLAIAAGAYQAWHYRNTMSTDGISYLDMADGIAHGRWPEAINAYWSPLYPVLLSAAIGMFRPSPWNEFTLVHAVNLAIYLGSVAAFEFFLSALVQTLKASLPSWLIRVIGYTLFLWGSLELISLTGTSPDLLVSLFVFWAAGLFLKIVSGQREKIRFVFLGVVLGLGYLAKAPLFPLALVIFFLVFFGVGSFRMAVPRVALSLLAFAVTASPYLCSLSVSKHRLTFGDSGKLNYAWYVDGASYRHWQGGLLGAPSAVAPLWSEPGISSGVPLHPTRKVLDTPPVYEFNGPVAGTYPVWFDPSYWNDGIQPRFNLRQQLNKVAVNLRFMYSLLLNVHAIQLYREKLFFKIFSPILLALWAALFLRNRLAAFAEARSAWLLFAFSAAALAMYALVYCEPRHLAPFVVLLLLTLFALLRVPAGQHDLWPAIIAFLVLLAFVGTVGTAFLSAPPPKDDDWTVASALHEMGIMRGTAVASVEYSNHANVKWAHLDRVRIVAEVYTDAFAPRGHFWRLDPALQAGALRAFRTAGAQFAVASDLPPSMDLPAGWQRVGNTKYILYRLR